jgi:hypothetical protein
MSGRTEGLEQGDIMRSPLAAAWLIALTSVANAQPVQYERIRLAVQEEIRVPTETLLRQMLEQCPRLMWLQERDCKDKIARITALVEDAIQKARPIALQIDFQKSVAARQEIEETIADINRSMRIVEGYIRNIRRKFSDHLATVFSEPIE